MNEPTESLRFKPKVGVSAFNEGSRRTLGLHKNSLRISEASKNIKETEMMQDSTELNFAAEMIKQQKYRRAPKEEEDQDRHVYRSVDFNLQGTSSI